MHLNLSMQSEYEIKTVKEIMSVTNLDDVDDLNVISLINESTCKGFILKNE